MKPHRKASVLSLGTASAACVIVAMASQAHAAAGTFKDHQSFNPTGAVFSCQGGDLTVTGGTISQTVEGVRDGRGVFHITGTLVPHNVTLTDGTHRYVLSGADWFGGKSLDANGNLVIESTDTSHFVIRNARGGVYAKVQIVEHMNRHHSFTFDRGSCETPSN